MNFIHLLDDPWAQHPVVNRHICNGGGGGESTPEAPDYSEYIAQMTKTGEKGLERSQEMYDWAKRMGVSLDDLAKVVSTRAGTMADKTGDRSERMMANWENTYGPLYQAQAADATRMIGELPKTEEQYAGKYAADVAQGFDAAKAANTRKLQSYGLKAPGVASQALDLTAGNQRAAAQVAASEAGRMAARGEARDVAGRAITQGQFMPGVAGQQANTSLAAGNQQLNAPESAISTTVGAHQPGLGYYSGAQPYMKAWGDTMMQSYNQQLQASKQASDSAGGGIGSMLGTVGGALAGSVMGPMGSSIGSSLGGSLMGAATGGKAKGGMVYADGGGVPTAPPLPGGPAPGGDSFVDPSMSPSQGAITDDVPARLNAGEFVFPKDVVAWRGEQWMHKEIMKARKEQQQVTAETGAEPDTANDNGAIDMKPPTFMSQGAGATA